MNRPHSRFQSDFPWIKSENSLNGRFPCNGPLFFEFSKCYKMAGRHGAPRPPMTDVGTETASLEPGPSRAWYFPRDMLLLTTTARERAWRLLKIHSQFFDYVFLELSRAFAFVWRLEQPYIRCHKPTETCIFAHAWLCWWSSNLRRYWAICWPCGIERRLVLTFPKTSIVTKLSLSAHPSKGPQPFNPNPWTVLGLIDMAFEIKKKKITGSVGERRKIQHCKLTLNASNS